VTTDFGGSSGIYRKDGGDRVSERTTTTTTIVRRARSARHRVRTSWVRRLTWENDDDDCETCAKCETSCADKLGATILIERTATTTTTIAKCVRGVIRGGERRARVLGRGGTR